MKEVVNKWDFVLLNIHIYLTVNNKMYSFIAFLALFLVEPHLTKTKRRSISR